MIYNAIKQGGNALIGSVANGTAVEIIKQDE